MSNTSATSGTYKSTKTRFQRFPARGARGYVGRPPKNKLPAPHLASISFEDAGSGAYHVVLELENRGGSVAKFSFSGLDTTDVISLDGAAQYVVIYELEFGAETVSVLVDGSILVEETVPVGGSFQ